MGKEKFCGIYKIQNLENGKVYIGASRNILLRWYQHKYDLRNFRHHSEHLQKAWIKYGEDSFQFDIIECCEERDLNNKEKFYIQLYKSNDKNYGYNIFDGGNTHNVPEETKKKLSLIHMGMTHNEETIKKMRNKAKKDKIAQLDLEGNLVRIWESTLEIKKELHIDTKDIRECCKKSNAKRKTAHSYVWLYYQDYISNNYNIKDYQNTGIRHPIKIHQYSLEYEYIATYDSIYKAGRILNIPYQNISRCVLGKTKTAGGYRWFKLIL